MPVTQRPNGSYQVTVCFGGRTLRKASRHWSFQDAREYERAWLSQVKDASLGRKPERTIEEALERWLTYNVPKLRSARNTEYHARGLLPYIAGRKLSESPQVWAEVKAGMPKAANATVNHKGRILRQLCNLALKEWDWMSRPVKITLLPETPRETFLTIDEVEAIARRCKNVLAGDYVRLAAYTGIRKGHLLRLTRFNVRDGWIYLDRSSKTRTLQMVPLHPKVKAIAERLPLAISRAQLDAAWRDARGNRKVRFHDLRHTCASWLVQAGVPLLTVKELLGHSTIAVTQRYAHLQPKHLQEAIEKIA
jgi:integrase